jgi:UTP-glucose-1-phosphate uridylyltransferase
MKKNDSGMFALGGEQADGFWAGFWRRAKRSIKNIAKDLRRLLRLDKLAGAPADVDTGSLEFVILAAGKSTRSYPHAKGLPHKSMMPFGSRKVIDHIMGQIIEAGGRHVTIVVSDESVAGAFRQCFRREPEIESKFLKKGNMVGLELLKSLYVPEDIDIKYVIQGEPKGTGHAVGLVYESIRKTGRNIVMIWPDDIFLSDRHAKYPEDRMPIYKRAVNMYVNGGGRGNVVITRYVKDPSRWGIVDKGYYVEKPAQSASHDAGVGFCIFDRKVCEEILKESQTLDRGEQVEGLVSGELTFIPALNRVIDSDPKVMKIRTVPMQPTDIYLDCGSIEGYEKALLYTLLVESKFNESNLRFIRAVLPRIENRYRKDAKGAK